MAGAVNRRSFLAGSASLLASTMAGGGVWASPNECGVQPRRYEADPQVAVSLRAISQQLQACKTGGIGACADAKYMGGMTRLDGFMVDRAERDIILWGRAETGEPRLVIDDFLVALRAAHWRYPTRENGRDVFYEPGISLDPDLAVYREFDEVYDPNDLSTMPAYRALCETPHHYIRVDGMPRDTRVSDVLLAADYKMKMVAAGRVQIPIADPFPPPLTMELNLWDLQRERGVLTRPSDAEGTRFWFSAGEFDYQVSPNNDTGFLETAQVILQARSRAQRNGVNMDIGMAEPAKHAFVCAWTDRMEDTYAAEPLWAEMRNMFRHFAIAKIIGRRDLIAMANFDGTYLLDGHAIPVVPLKNAVPGVWTETERPNGMHYYCGGVSVGFSDDNLKHTVEDGAATDSRRRVAASRPARSDVIAWGVRG